MEQRMMRALTRLLLACILAAGMSAITGCGGNGGNGGNGGSSNQGGDDSGLSDDTGGSDSGSQDIGGLDSGGLDAGEPDSGDPDTGHDASSDAGSSDVNEDADEDTGANTSPTGQFCDQMIDAMMAKFEECMGGPQDIWTSFLEQNQDICGTMVAGVDAGRITFHQANTQSCLDSLDTISCDVLMDSKGMPQDCQAALEGTVAQSGACYDSGECAGDSYCTETALQCPGQCEPRAAEGESCASNSECEGQLECDFTSSTCEQPDTSGTDPGLGESCPNGDCQMGLVCNPDNSICEEYDREGDACVPGDSTCELFTYCDNSQTCVRYNGAGATCGMSNDGEWAGCLPGTYCDFGPSTSGTCETAKAIGESCQGDTECQSAECSEANECIATCAPPAN
jgi:hypothetical protein